MPQRTSRFAPVAGSTSNQLSPTDGTVADVLLRLLIPPERQRALARSMLRASRTSTGRFRMVISKTMQQEFHLNGVSRASSEQRDITQVTSLTNRSDRALMALSRTWLIANDELRERVLLQLAPYALEVVDPDIALRGFWEMDSAAPAFTRAREALFDVAPDDLLLAWTLLTGRMLLPVDERPEQVRALVTTPDEPFPMHPDDIVTPERFGTALWADIVASVSNLADDDAAWSELEQAVDALQRLAHLRQARREARWAPLRSAIVAVQEQPQRMLVDLSITGVATWDAEQCPPDQVDAPAVRGAAQA